LAARDIMTKEFETMPRVIKVGDLYDTHFMTGFALQDAIGSHACSLETCVQSNSMHLGCSLFYRLAL
jgi:hypothetical protein